MSIKTFFVPLVLLVASVDYGVAEEVEEVMPQVRENWQDVRITVYNCESSQTDDTPFITADNSRIDVKALRDGGIRWVAVSRDLLEEYSYGDTIDVFIEDGHPKNGVFVIHDTMAKRFSKCIDILTYSDKNGKWNGKIKRHD